MNVVRTNLLTTLYQPSNLADDHITRMHTGRDKA